MGQNNDPTEHGDLQGQQGAPKGEPKSAYMKTPDREGSNPFRGEDTAQSLARRPANPLRENSPNGILLPNSEPPDGTRRG